MASTSTDRDRVLVVGGGIAGLAAAAALQRRGIEVVVFETLPMPSDGGLGVNLPGNAVSALAALGLGPRIADLGTPVRRREYRTSRDRLLFAVDEDRFWGRGSRSRCVQRSDLHMALQGLVAAGTVRLGASVRTVREHDGGAQVELADGTVHTGGVVLGADGVHSVVRRHVAPGRPARPAILASSSWRFVTANPGIDCWVVWTGAPGTALLIPLGRGEVYGWMSAKSETTEFAQLRSRFRGFPDVVRAALATATRAGEPPLHSPLEEVNPAVWTSGRVVLIGDAAHATAPVWAQGAALAIEDALVLADVLRDPGAWGRAGDALAARRRARVEHVQAMTDRFSRAATLPAWLRSLVAPLVGPRSYREAYEPLKEPVG